MIWRWLLGQSHDLGRLSDAWLADRRNLERHVRWDARQKKSSIETHAYHAATYGAAERARREMREERHQSYLERTQSVVGCSRRGGTGIPTAPLTA